MSWFSSAVRKITKEAERAVSSVTQEADRFLDRRIGIDDPDIRTGIIIAGGAIAGAGVAGAAAGGAFTGGIGLSAGLATTTAVIGGAVVGATIAASGLRDPAAERAEPLDPLKPFSLPTNFELTSARDELQSSLRRKRARSKTDFTGGLIGGAGIRPRLRTA